MTCQPDILWKAVRVLLPLEFHPDSSVCVLGNPAALKIKGNPFDAFNRGKSNQVKES